MPITASHADNCYVESPNVPNCVNAAREAADDQLAAADDATRDYTTEVEYFAPPPGAAVDPVADPLAPMALDAPATPELDSDGPLPATNLLAIAGQSSTKNCFGYGNARGMKAKDGVCPPLHWNRGGSATTYIRIEDHTGSAWPVHTAANYWTGSARVDMLYTTACPSSYHCVKVYEGRYGATGWVGLTKVTYDGYHHITNVSIQYNDSYTMTAAQHLTTTCHEQGHALGLEHNLSTSSCLYYRVGSATTGTSDDMNELYYNMYDH
jgi:hypothetical protein